MKTILKGSVTLFFIFIIATLNANGQASYNGGQAGGYAAFSVSLGGTSIPIGDSLITKQFDALVFPNPIKRGQLIKCRIKNFDAYSKLTVILIDVLGNKLMVDNFEIITDEVLLPLPIEKMVKGIYLITFHNSKSKVTRRLVLVE
jgi:hypothetical protein